MAKGITLSGPTAVRLDGLRKVLGKLMGGNRPGVKVGVLNGAKYSEGPAAGEYIAVNMARHEFGADNIPARAPFRTTTKNKQNEWKKDFADYVKKAGVESLGQNPRPALEVIGDVAAVDIQKSFEEGLNPPLKEETIEQKKRMTREGKLLPKGETGDYAEHASKPVMLTGQGQKAIKSEYVEDLRSIQ